ncbi:MAG: DUF6460 domain-containing protein [Beijerinckiaceae bacterium]
MSNDAISRLLGGNPVSVAIKLVIVSVIVGALLHFAGLSPASLFNAIARMMRELIGSGWDAVRTVGEFALYGAVIVVPIFLLTRLLAGRK